MNKKTYSILACILLITSIISHANALSVQTLSYDPNGNLISDGKLTYVYDEANRLKEVKQDGSPIARYWYDENGNRIKKQEGTTTTYYIGGMEARETSGGGTDTVNYVHANGELVAKQNTTGTYITLTDHLGSTDVIIDASGNKIEDIEYEPYGGVLAGGAAENKLFTSKEKDAIGLYYYGARYYNPATTRFTQPDTVIPDVYNPQDLNRYTYVRNNPLKYTDPTGHKVTYEKVYDSESKKNRYYIYTDGKKTGEVIKTIAYQSQSNPDHYEWDQEVILPDGSTRMLSDIIGENQKFTNWGKQEYKDFGKFLADFGLSLSGLKEARAVVKSKEIIGAWKFADTAEDVGTVLYDVGSTPFNDQDISEDTRKTLWDGTEFVPVWSAVKVALDYSAFYDKGLRHGDVVYESLSDPNIPTEYGTAL